MFRRDGFGGEWQRSPGLVPPVMQLCMLSFVSGQDLVVLWSWLKRWFCIVVAPQHDWIQGIDYMENLYSISEIIGAVLVSRLQVEYATNCLSSFIPCLPYTTRFVS